MYRNTTTATPTPKIGVWSKRRKVKTATNQNSYRST